MTNYEANSNNWNDKKVKTRICLSALDGPAAVGSWSGLALTKSYGKKPHYSNCDLIYVLVHIYACMYVLQIYMIMKAFDGVFQHQQLQLTYIRMYTHLSVQGFKC